MDDLQWADLGSLELLEAISCDTENHGLAIIGICRSDEVSIDNDFARILRRLEEEKDIPITNIVVHCLSLQGRNHIFFCPFHIDTHRLTLKTLLPS